MSKPKFAIGEIVYLAEPAASGELEAYRISSVRKTGNNWIYSVDINQKPPAEQTVGDRIDLKSPLSFLFEETELITLCEALDSAILSLESRITRLNLKYTDCLDNSTFGDGAPLDESVPDGYPKFQIGDIACIRASAALGFIEGYNVVSIHKPPTYNKYTYTLNLTNTTVQAGLPRFKDNLYFKQSELLTSCEALNMAISTLDRKLAALTKKKESLCPNTTG